LRVAAVQLNSNSDKERNLATAERLVRAAAVDGAEFVALPEKWNLLGSGEELVAGAEPLDAVRLQVILLWMLLGSVALAALVAVSLGYRGFFTPAHQLREPPG
jgi:hypothetical protein